MADFQAKICEKFNIKSLTDNQSKFITAIIDGKDVFVGTKTGSAGITKIRLTMPKVKLSRANRNPWLAKMPLNGLMIIV
jgi:phosphoenolpyruvate carboxylase